ncbi:hypothetical protein ROE7235_03850 [Roseibaca ekhonensis]|uniref:Uncharacterized protein n=1 Tax=Roseinatronobacter ekhonensis TaxID=254356 RepID=A0A3B0MKI2_9RHOB|nr:hypothetical protein ROE7235_03850 [Roseibaca ekhonensis]
MPLFSLHQFVKRTAETGFPPYVPNVYVYFSGQI